MSTRARSTSSRVGQIAALSVVFVLSFTPVHAQRTAVDEDEPKLFAKNLSLGLGFSTLRLDTNFKFTEDATGRSIFIDGEGTLNLPRIDTSPVLVGQYRFAGKNAISFGSFQLRRDSVLIAERVNLGDYTVTGTATLSDRSRFYFLNYSRSLIHDERARISIEAGLYGIDLDYRLNLAGELAFKGDPLLQDQLTTDAGIFAPLPVFGIDAGFSFTEKWSTAVRVALVGGKFGTIKGAVTDTTIRARYKFNNTVSGVLGISYFNARLELGDTDFNGNLGTSEIGYGLDGLYLGVALEL